MGVSSYFEFVTTLFGWIMYDNIWSVLSGSGLVYLPFLIMVVGNIISSMKAGDDEGSAGVQSLKKIQTDFISMVLVLIIACIPVADVVLGEMRFTKPALDCQAAQQTISGDNTGTTYDSTLATLGGEIGRIPAWWALVHVVSKSIVSASIASIPCSYDLASVEAKLAGDNIEDPRLRVELEEFIQDCYMTSKSRLIRTQTGVLTPAQWEEANWVGSKYFLDTAGYYDKSYANKPRADWPYNATRDAGFEDDAALGGHPMCDEWWSNGSTGIRRQVLDSVSTENRNTMIYGAGNMIDQVTGNSLSTTEREDLFLRKYIDITTNKRAYTGTSGQLSESYSLSAADQMPSANAGIGARLIGMIRGGATLFVDGGTLAIAAVGAAVSLPGALAEGEMIREGISIVQGLLLMIVIILLPFLQIIALYRISVILTLSVIFFAIHFFSFLWGIAYWVDNSLISALLSEGSFTALANPTQSLILLWVQRILYIYFPLVFLTAMGWVGIRAGQLGTDMSVVNNTAAVPAKTGGGVTTSVATKGAK